jgi:hypothetical protein
MRTHACAGYTDRHWKAVWASLMPIDVEAEAWCRESLTSICFGGWSMAGTYQSILEQTDSEKERASIALFIEQIGGVIDALSDERRDWVEDEDIVDQLEEIQKFAKARFRLGARSNRTDWRREAKKKIWGMLLQWWVVDLSRKVTDSRKIITFMKVATEPAVGSVVSLDAARHFLRDWKKSKLPKALAMADERWKTISI